MQRGYFGNDRPESKSEFDTIKCILHAEIGSNKVLTSDITNRLEEFAEKLPSLMEARQEQQ